MKNRKNKNFGRALPKVIVLLLIGSIVLAIGIVFGVKMGAQHGLNLFAKKVEQAVPESVPVPVPSPVIAPPTHLEVAQVAIFGSSETRKEALQTLTMAEMPHPETVAYLSELLKSTDIAKVTVLPALVAVVPKNPEAVALIASALTDPAAKKEAIESLGQLGPLAASAAPAVKKIANNPKEKKAIRRAANTALVHMKPPVTEKPVKKKTGKPKKKKK